MATIVIWGKEYPVPEKYTLGETADIERICDGALNQQDAKVRMMLASVWIAVRRVDQTATLDQIRDLDFDEIEWVTEDPPAPGAESPATDGDPSSSESTGSDLGNSTVS